MMKTNNNGCDICHNVQIAVDDKTHLVVAVDVTSQPVDKEQLYNMASQAKGNLEIDEITVVADKGYYSSRQFMLCETDVLSRLFPVPNRISTPKTSNIPKKDFNTIMADTYARLVKP